MFQSILSVDGLTLSGYTFVELRLTDNLTDKVTLAKYVTTSSASSEHNSPQQSKLKPGETSQLIPEECETPRHTGH